MDRERAGARYDLRELEIDATFGLVEIDPYEHVYTALVEETAAEKLHPSWGGNIEGPFSNPRVQPFGPPTEDGSSDSTANA